MPCRAPWSQAERPAQAGGFEQAPAQGSGAALVAVMTRQRFQRRILKVLAQEICNITPISVYLL